MASLENVQGSNNSQDVNLAGRSPSNDLLQIGADALARGRAAGFSDEETLAVYNHRKALQGKHVHPIRKDQKVDAELAQKIASIRSQNPAEINDSDRRTSEVATDQVQFELDGRERDQSVEEAYYGRDENAFSVYDRKKQRNRDIVIPSTDRTVVRNKNGEVNDAMTASIRREAENRSYGIREVPKEFNGQYEKEDVKDYRDRVKRNKDGTKKQRIKKIIETTYKETGPGQGGSVGNIGGSAVGRTQQELAMKLRQKIESGEVQLDENGWGYIKDRPDAINPDKPVNILRLLDDLERTSDPRIAKEREADAARGWVQRDNANFSAQKRADVIEAERHMVNAATNEQGTVRERNRAAQGRVSAIPYIPGGLTSAKTHPDQGIAVKALRAESDARFNARPQAVQLDGDAREIAEALGISSYVDADSATQVYDEYTGRLQNGSTPAEVGVIPEKLNTNHAGSDVQINAPQTQTVTTAAKWVTDNLRNGKTGDMLADTNMSQITSDFSRRVQAAAPGYVAKTPTSVQEFDSLIQRVISQRSADGEPFYKPVVDDEGNAVRYASGKRKGRQKQQVVSDPGVAEVMRLLRFTSGEEGQLANALYSMSLAAEGSRPVGSFSDGVNVSMGSMFGEKLDVGTAGRDSTRAAFGRLPDTVIDEETGATVSNSDAQRPQIGGIREYDENGALVRQEKPIGRRVSKGRTPDEAVAVYRAQRAKNGQPVDEAYARQIADENASLRADQDVTDMAVEQRMVDQNPATSTAQPPSKVAEDEAFFEGTGARSAEVGRMKEAEERVLLADLIQKGARFGSDSGFGSKTARRNVFSSGTSDYYEKGSGKWSMSGRDAGQVEPGRKLDVPTYRDKRLTSTTTPEYRDGYTRTTTPGRAADFTGIAPATAPGRFAALSPTTGGNGVKPPTTNVSAAFAPEPSGESRLNRALKDQILARVDQKRQARRRNIGGGAAAASGVAALIGALTGGQQQEEQF